MLKSKPSSGPRPLPRRVEGVPSSGVVCAPSWVAPSARPPALAPLPPQADSGSALAIVVIGGLGASGGMRRVCEGGSERVQPTG